ncbi:MAG: PAS domain-containing protein, partial [Halobacteriales archaeon]
MTEMHDGVVVVDDADRIVHINPAALELFEREREPLLGEPLEALLEDGLCSQQLGDETGDQALQRQSEQDCAITTTDSGRHVSVGSSPLTDGDGDRLGRMLLLRDVTQQRRRTQGLEVLNRVLRHDLRNALQVVRGRLDMARERAAPSVASVLQPAEEQVDRLLSTADTARHFEAVFEQQERARLNLTRVGRALVDRARARYSEASIQASLSDQAVVEAPASLRDALWQLVENACEHAGDRP